MKKLITQWVKIFTLASLLFSSSISNAQNFTLSVQNLVQSTPNTLDFDVYILNTNSSQPFELAGIQVGFLLNSFIYTGGTLTAVINNTGSGLVSGQQFVQSVNNVITNAAFPNQTLVRQAGRSPVGAGSGTIISTVAPGTLVTHFTLTSTVNFTSNSTTNLTFTPSTALNPEFPTVVDEYIASVNTPLTVTPGTNAIVNGNPVLNAGTLPAAFSVTGSGSYCNGGTGLPVGLSGSESGVTYTLFKNTIAQVPTVAGTGSAISFGNQLFGTYTVSGTNGNGTTAMTGSSVIVENPVLSAPVVGTITQPTCATATGSVVLSGLPAGNWTINPGAIAGNTTSFTVLNLATGTYNFTVTNSTGCVSTATANVVINAQPATPTAPIVGTITQPTCATATGSVVLSGLPTGNWTINPGAIAGNTTSFTVLNLATGTYNFTVTNSTGCVSTATANVVINAQPATPTAPIVGTITQPTCATATGSVALSGLPSGTWTVTATPGGATLTGSITTGTFTGLIAGTYTFTVSDAAGCISAASGNAVINAAPSTPTTPVVGTITQPTCATATGSVVLSGLPAGNWTINPGAIAGNTTSFTVLNLATGTYNFTVTNSTGCVSTATANVVINAQPATPTTPIVGTITQPTCATATGSVVLSGLPAGNWTINPGAIAGNTTSFTVLNLATGTYNFTVTNSTGCVSTATANAVINAQPATPTTPIVGTITQPTCATATGSVVLSGLPAGNWTINPGAIAGNTTSFTVLNLATGTYNFTVTNSTGCVSTATANAVINAQPATPTAPIVGTITQPTCATATGSVVLSGLPTGTWTVTATPGGATLTGSITTGTFIGLAAGTYTFTVSDAAGCISAASGNAVINAAPSTPTTPVVGTITQPTCATATGSVVLSGLPAGNWTINPGAIAGNTTSFTVLNLATGIYNFTVTNSTGCVSTPTANVVINSAPSTPTTPVVGTITQPTCATATGSVVLSGLPAGNWTINPGAIAGNTTSFTVLNLATGTFNFTVTNSTGCISTATANVVINAQPVTPTAPVVGTITQPTCATATGSVALSGLPSGTWTVTASPGGATLTGSITTGTFTGLIAGTYTFTVSDAAGCISSASGNAVINAAPSTPTTPIVGTITQPTCATATGSVVLSGLPTGNWTINPGAIAGNTTSFTVLNLATGTYNFTVTNSTGCVSTATANVVINAAPSAPITPIVGTITQPTCATATGSVVLSGLPAGNWTINPGAIAGNTTSFTVLNLATGTYNFTVTNSTGCVSAPTANVVINAAPSTPTTPVVGTITQPTCATATGSVVLSGLPTGNWTINPGAIAGNTTSFTVLNLATGTYNFTVTNSTGCVSAPTANVVINAQPATPTAPIVGTITQPTCATATGSVALSGLPSGTWTVTAAPGGATLTGSITTGTFTGLIAGTYTFTVSDAAGCISSASGNAVINAAPSTPTTPVVGTITQPTCATATGSVVLSGLPAGNWTINPGAIAGNTTSFTVLNLAAGTYNFTVTNSTGCVSTATANVVINAQPVTPTAPVVGTITQPTCATATGSVALSGLPSGTWTVTASPGGATLTGSITTGTFTGLIAGTYTFTVSDAAGCISAASGNAVINAAPSTPTTPVVGTITQPTCATATGSVVLSGLPAGNWTINPGAMAGNTTSFTVLNLATGTYNFTVTNSTGCVSTATANVVINAQPATPTAPIVGTITQPTCATATGSVALSGLPSGTWTATATPGGATLTGSITTGTFTGLIAGTYTFTVSDAAGCISSASGNAVINAAPSTPTTPVVGTITQPTCATATGSVVLSGLPAGNWTINPGAIAGNTTSFTVLNLATGTYNFTVTNSTGCVSTATANVVINAAPSAPTTPIVGTITQPTCATATGSVVLSGLPTGNWTINPGAIAGNTTSFTVLNLATGTYNFTVTNSTGCVSTATANAVINAQPATPTAPIVGTITQPTCATATGSVVLSGLPAGNWTINPGSIAGNTTSFTVLNLATGTYNFTVTNSVGCVSAATANVVINAAPSAPTTPIVGTITQPTCATATGSVVLSGLPTGNWTINPGAIAGNTTSFTVLNLATGTYNFTVTNSTGCVSTATANAVINAQPATPTAPIVGTITQPTCATATGSVVLSGLPAGNWTINPGSIAGNTTSFTVLNLATGTYNFTVTNSVGCVSAATANVVINAAPSAPTTPIVGTITQPTCATATGSVVLSGLPTGNWTINPGAIAGYTTSFTVLNLAAGTFNFTVTNSTGCVSAPTANVVINAAPSTPTTPVVGTITQPTCATATGSVVLSGLPTGNWTINPGAIAGNTTSFTVLNLAAGTYNFTVTNSTGCVSTATANVVINAQPVTPTTPVVGTITQPTCATATGSVVLSGLPAGNWTINPGAIAGNTTSFTVLNLASGTYNFTVTNSTGCISAATANVVINAQPATPTAPIVGTITQPTCATATGSVALSGLPSGTWTVAATPGGATLTGSITTGTFTGLIAGTYTFTVSDAAGCISSVSGNAVINAAPSTPTTPVVGTITQPTCATATGSVVLSGLPAGNWTINPGAIAGNTTSFTVLNLATGTYNFTVTNSTGCVSTATANVVINAAPSAPTTPIVGTITQPTCATATGSVVLSGLPAGNWTINPGAIAGNTTSFTVLNLATGTYNFTVTNSTGCVSAPTANVVINAAPSTPTTPVVGTITQPTCATATGSVVLSGLPTGNWTINPGAIAGNTTSFTVLNLAAGTYNFTVTNSTGCVSTATANVVINAAPSAPTTPIVGTITQPTCATATGSVVLSGLPTGNWTINPGAIAGNSTSFTVLNLAAGTYNFTVTNSVGCVSAATANVVINAAPSAPTTPIVGTIAQPTCATATGSVVLSGLPTGNWTINPGAIAGNTTSFTVLNLAAGTYNFTITNSTGCVSAPTANVVINAAPSTPTTPVVGTITQPTCATATGSVVLSGLPAGNWTINPGAIAGNTTSFTVLNLASGTYNFTVTNSTGCISAATANVVINTQPIAPSITGTTPNSFCGSGTVTLGATATSGTIHWYANVTGGVSLGIGTSFTTPLISSTTSYYVDATQSGCTSSPRIAVTATISNVAQGGTLSGPNSIVYGNSTGVITLSGYLGNIVKWQKRIDSNSWTDINNTTDIYSETPESAGTWQYRVVVQNACSIVNSSTLSIIVEPATLTVTADNALKVYGATNPGLTMSYAGFVNGDNASSIIIPTITTTATTGSIPGDYPIVLSGGSAQNYILSLVNGTMKVNKADLTFIADNKTRNYLEANPTLTYIITGFVSGDSKATLDVLPVIVTTADQNSASGDYPITISGGADNCYNYLYQSGTLSIEKISQTVTITDVPTKLFLKNTYNCEATSSSGLPVQFESITPELSTVTGSNVYGVSSGKAQIRAFQPGDRNYYPAEAFAQIEITSTHRDIMHLFTPNNDGINDLWEIPDISTYGKCDVKVYNRWGKEVYANKNYDNLWDGTSDGSPLPEGAYYFVIKTENSGVISGTVNIVR